MNYKNFIKLEWKRFKRSPNFSKKLVFKILTGIGYFFMFLYLIGLSFIAYYAIRDKFPSFDAFKKGSQYLYIFFAIVFMAQLYINSDSFKVRYFMLLPIKKNKIVKYYLLKILFHPVNLTFMLMLVNYSSILLFNHYDVLGVFAWTIAMISTLIVINFLFLFAEKISYLKTFMSLLLMVFFLKMKFFTSFLAPIGMYFYQIYERPYLFIMPLLILIFTYIFIFNYIFRHFYLDNGLTKAKNTNRNISQLAWLNNFGLMGQFIKNDVRLIWRNERPKHGLISVIVFLVFGALIVSDYNGNFHQAYFYKVMFSIFVTGSFIAQFGSFIPAWDSAYYPMLMSQNLKYRQYLEAKWWIMALSVLVLLILSLPYLYFGWKVYSLVLVTAVFNIGVNIPLTMISGMFRTQPIRLDKKVKAFQNNQAFDVKLMIYNTLRLLLPIIVFILLEKYFGYQYGIAFFLVLGILGILFRNWFLDKLVRYYIKRKYISLAGFRNNSD